MRTSETINKALVLTPPEDYNFLRREGIKNIEKLGGDVWTDFNTHDPGITLLENLCYAITDLAYRTGFDMKDLLAKTNPGSNAWKNIFYTAREILPCNPITINDYRKLVMDVEGVRNAWITISRDCEVPIYLKKPTAEKFDEIKEAQKDNLCCESSIRLPYTLKEEAFGLNFNGDKIIELNGLYKIIVEYEEDIREKKKETTVRQQVLKVLHRNRNLCEDFLSVTGAEYKDFFLQATVLISESADADMILAQMSYSIQNYFTPVLRFYSLDEMISLGIPVDEIFEGPALKHGFIRDDELEKTDMFRDMRLSDIINFISDIEGVNALQRFMIKERPDDNENKAKEEDEDKVVSQDNCSNEAFFADWIDKIKREKLVGRLSIEDMLKFFHPSEEESITPVSDIHFIKPSGEVTINTDRFEKLLNDLRGRDKYMKMTGFKNNFPVPVGENMELENFYPVQYQLPFTYRVGEPGLPLREGKYRLIQSLQLKGYLAVFEQLFLNYLYLLDNMNEIFSFGEVSFKGKTAYKKTESPCDPEEEDQYREKGESTETKAFQPPRLNQIIYKDEQDKIVEKIAGYKCLYYDAEKYLSQLQGIIQSESDFEWQRNAMLDHLLSRFNEEMSEYVSLMKYMYPSTYLPKIIKNKTDLLSDYPAISNYRSRAFNYQLEEEKTDIENPNHFDEEKIALNISGLEKRIARLIGLASYKRRDLSPDNLFVETIVGRDGKEVVKVVLYEDQTRETVLLETRTVDSKCSDELMHAFIDSGCCVNNFRKYPEQQAPHRRVHHHQHHAEYSFVLKDSEGRELAHSPLYHSVKHRDKAMRLAECYLEKICLNEGFHMIEHILLRPKGDTQITDSQGNYGDEFKLLGICLDKCDLTIQQDATDKVDYKFDLEIVPPERCLDGNRWKVILNRINHADPSKPTKILERTFKDFDLASDFISTVREYGSELVNYTIYKTRTNNKFYFKLKDKNGTTLVESSCFDGYSKDPTLDEKAIPGVRTQCDSTITDKKIFEEILELKQFLAYELDLYCCEEPCDHNEDPYSFRLTFVLPCWPKRFRNKGFRKFVEKIIQQETPAHIHANIFWLGITQMRNYEEAYFNWLIEMSANDVPDIGICNTLITQVINLKDCNEECDEGEMYVGKQPEKKNDK